jgi:hypothetical protein
MTDTYNILNQWSKIMQDKCSPFQYTQEKRYSKSDILEIVQIFQDFFDEEYFDVPYEKLAVRSNPQVYFNRNLLFNYMTINSTDSYYVISEIASLLKFSKEKFPPVYTNLSANRKNPDDLRSYLYEVFIIRLLYYNGYPLVPKPEIEIGNKTKELDGIVKINDKHCLIECKKTHVVEKNRYDYLVSSLLNYFHFWMQHQQEHFAFILAPKNEEKKLGEYKKVVTEAFRNYYKKLLKGERPENPYIIELENETLLHIEEKKPGLFENVSKTIKVPYSFLNVYPPPTGLNKEKNNYQFHFGITTSFTKDEAFKNFIQKLENKRKQHKEIKGIPKIFFFDNERLYLGEPEPIPEFLLSSDRITNYLANKNIEEIIVITTRIYDRDQPAKCRLDIFHNETNKEIAEALKRLKIFSNTH